MKIIKFTLVMFVAFLLSSCAATFRGYTTNGTTVNLEQNNFTVVDRVEAYTTASYFLGIGGNKKDGLISEAKAKLSSKANLIGKPKALANEVVDIKTQIIFGIITRYTVTVSADVVEFK
jgi:hypothetical protein